MPSSGRSCLTVALAVVAALSAARAQTPLTPDGPESGQLLLRYPVARRSGQADRYHGVRVADPYRGLEDVAAPETRQWVAAERALTASYLSRVPRRPTIRARVAALSRFVGYSAPVRAGDRLFWFEAGGTHDVPVLFEKDAGAAGARVLLDPAALSTDGTAAVAASAPSPDGRYVAYVVSSSASVVRRIRVRDARTGRDLNDEVRRLDVAGIAWTRDSRGFFYVASDSTERAGAAPRAGAPRCQKVYYHRVGRSAGDDQVIFERPDHPDWRFATRVSDDGHYALVSISSGEDERNRLYFIDLDDPGRPRISAPIVRLFDNADAHYDFVSSQGQTFFIRTTRNAPRGQLVAVDINEPHEAQWQPIVREGLDPMVDARQVGSRFVVHFLRDARSRLALYTLDGQSRGEVTLPAFSTVTELSTRAEDTDFFFTVASFLSPPAVYDYDTEARIDLLYRMPTLDADLSAFETKQVFYTSRDGTQVPMFLTARKGLALDGEHPTLLRGDGAFGVAQTPTFSPAVVAWLEMGGVYAVADLRGGGEYGKAWHEAGMLAHKQNVFDDFIAAARYLIAQRYTSPRRLAISGAANGALVVGAVLTQRPDLFGAALATDGPMDMLRYQLFGDGWAWAPEYGTSDDAEQFRYLLAWSPLQNVHAATRYPATLVTTEDGAASVAPAHAYKFVAALQAAQGGDAPVLLAVEGEGTTGAPRPLSREIDASADWLAFLARNLDVHP